MGYQVLGSKKWNIAKRGDASIAVSPSWVGYKGCVVREAHADPKMVGRLRGAPSAVHVTDAAVEALFAEKSPKVLQYAGTLKTTFFAPAEPNDVMYYYAAGVGGVLVDAEFGPPRTIYVVRYEPGRYVALADAPTYAAAKLLFCPYLLEEGETMETSVAARAGGSLSKLRELLADDEEEDDLGESKSERPSGEDRADGGGAPTL